MTPNAGRRDPRSHQAILRAAYELALEVGPARVTVEAIAARAGAGKQTIYRWWPSKGAVFLDVYNTEVSIAREIPDTGDLAADVKTQMKAIVELFNGEFGRFYAGLIALAQGDPGLARALGETTVDRAEEPRAERIRKAQREGQIRADLDAATIVVALFAPLHYQLLLHTRPLSTDQVDAIVDLVFNGLMPSAPTRSSQAEDTIPPPSRVG
jgi:AcrR family transcriptional regulator